MYVIHVCIRRYATNEFCTGKVAKFIVQPMLMFDIIIFIWKCLRPFGVVCMGGESVWVYMRNYWIPCGPRVMVITSSYSKDALRSFAVPRSCSFVIVNCFRKGLAVFKMEKYGIMVIVAWLERTYFVALLISYELCEYANEQWTIEWKNTVIELARLL